MLPCSSGRAPSERMFATLLAETSRRRVAACIPDIAIDSTLLMSRPRTLNWPANLGGPDQHFPAMIPLNCHLAVYPGFTVQGRCGAVRPQKKTTTIERCAYIR